MLCWHILVVNTCLYTLCTLYIHTYHGHYRIGLLSWNELSYPDNRYIIIIAQAYMYVSWTRLAHSTTIINYARRGPIQCKLLIQHTACQLI